MGGRGGDAEGPLLDAHRVRAHQAQRQFEFRIEATEGAARAGTLSLPHGEVRTPAFMPVGTHGVVRGLSAGDVERLEAAVAAA